MRRFLKTLFLTLLFFSLSGCFKQEEERGLQKNIEIKRNNPDEYVKKEDKNEIQKSVEKSETPKALPDEKSGFIEFNDKFFISRVNDIYINRGDYLGKKVRIEGNASEKGLNLNICSFSQVGCWRRLSLSSSATCAA